MPLHAPDRRRERILIYGTFNAGKSSAWLSIAEWLHRSKSTAKVRVADNDSSWDAMRPGDGHLDSTVQVTRLYPDDYRKWLDWAKGAVAASKPDDWLVVDACARVWHEAQAHYWNQRTGGEELLPDAFLKGQADPTHVGGPHGVNWGVVNKYYFAFMDKVINAPCHVLLVTSASALRPDAPAEELAKYRQAKWSPDGQKALSGQVLTELFAGQIADKWFYTTVREKKPLMEEGRKMLVGEKVSEKGFVWTYLIPVAGWSMD